MSWRSGENKADAIRRPYETDVSRCKDKFKSSIDARYKTNTNKKHKLGSRLLQITTVRCVGWADISILIAGECN
jgi:hypothetical protein